MAQGFWAPQTPCRFFNALHTVITVNFSPNAEAFPRGVTLCKPLFLQEYLPFRVFVKLAYRKFTGVCGWSPYTHALAFAGLPSQPHFYFLLF